MYQAHQAYNKVAKQVLPPRDLEASLLMKAATQLQHVYDNWDDSQSVVDHALYYNRKLWVALLEGVMAEDHPLPPELKRNIASLATFILNHTLDIQADTKKEKLTVLISINKNIAAGLLQKQQIQDAAVE